MHHLLIKQETKQCESCAYKESGHVVFAYLCGYSCIEMQLMKTSDEEGPFTYALIDYGKDTPIALKYVGENANLQHFTSLSLSERFENIETGQRLARIFIGGSVAAAVYRNDGDVHIPLPMQIDYTDLTKVEYIHSVLREMTANSEIDFLENELANALYTLNNSHIWKSIEHLAGRLLEENYLDKGSIEETLEKTGLLPLYA
jgi:hypothetical protein